MEKLKTKSVNADSLTKRILASDGEITLSIPSARMAMRTAFRVMEEINLRGREARPLMVTTHKYGRSISKVTAEYYGFDFYYSFNSKRASITFTKN